MAGLGRPSVENNYAGCVFPIAWPVTWCSVSLPTGRYDMTNATHTNKKTGMMVSAFVCEHKASNGETRVKYQKIKDGKRHGPCQVALQDRFNYLYQPV